MSSRISFSDHSPVIPLSGNEASTPPQKSVAALRVIFDSSSHENLLAAAAKAKDHFESLTASENISLAVTEKIILKERSAASTAATTALDAKSQSIPIINTLRYQCHDQKLLSTIAALELRLKAASEEAALSASHATSATQKQTVQVDAKSAALHAADARLALVQLQQLEPQRSGQSSKQGEAELEQATTEYQKTLQELTSLIAKTSPDIQITAAAHAHHLDSDKEPETTDESRSSLDSNSDGEEEEESTLDNTPSKELSDQQPEKSIIAAVESGVPTALKQDSLSASHAGSTTQKQAVQVDTVSAAKNKSLLPPPWRRGI